MSVKTTRTTTLPKNFHSAVVKWQQTYLPDYDYLMENWERYFPREPKFQLCAYREMGMCTEIECGDLKGKPKYTAAADMMAEQSHHLLGAIRAQASTEFGSIQQHRLTLARAQSDEEQFWILRMMAEELRHGYQMLHLLVEDDWSCVSKESSADMVEDILSRTTGSHLLGAFNIDFDSFVDNVVFCALIDRVGKYQLAMQKVSAYQPMAESMPQMLREEAFHLAAGVVPMRRWVQSAARGEGFVSMDMLQRALNKWLPRGLEMFGDERGGGTNVRYGLKPMKNDEAQRQYYEEVAKLVRDLNMRYVRARLPHMERKEAEGILNRILAEGVAVEGIQPEDLLYMPAPEFFRRRGVPAFTMTGFQGESFDDAEAYLDHLSRHLPDAYRVSSDYKEYVDLLRQVAKGELEAKKAASRAPALRRVGGSCPCSKSVRWVIDEPRPASPHRVGAGAEANA
ncbi:MAG TPA: Phenylacetic acid catabolic protein [Thermoanaerobaculia bacterium]|nr:Phenylacetic acid catabolic protein [Thermoanaerobaculia bacterium]